MSESYNGWTNWETWSVGVVLANDEGLYHESRAIVESAPHPGAALREYVEGLAPLFDWDLDPVDWVELLESVRDE
jgi:hypothetical protein